jgi:hypothetical protein
MWCIEAHKMYFIRVGISIRIILLLIIIIIINRNTESCIFQLVTALFAWNGYAFSRWIRNAEIELLSVWRVKIPDNEPAIRIEVLGIEASFIQPKFFVAE